MMSEKKVRLLLDRYKEMKESVFNKWCKEKVGTYKEKELSRHLNWINGKIFVLEDVLSGRSILLT